MKTGDVKILIRKSAHPSSLFLSVKKTVTWISAKMDVSLSTVSYWKKRHQETGDVRRKDESGKTKKITQEDEENIVSAVLAKPIITAQEIAGKIN